MTGCPLQRYPLKAGSEPLIGKVMDSSGTTSVIFLLVAIASGASAVTASFIRR